MGLNAVVTLVTTDSYVPGALVAVHSLLEAEGATPANPFETVCLVTPATVSVQSIKALRRNFSLVVGVEELRSGSRDELELLGRQDLASTLTKLHLFRLVQFRKVIFLDADTLCLQPLSHLFNLAADFSAAPDSGWPDCFNSGMFVATPSADTFDRLVEMSTERGSWDGGDQGLLNDFFPDWNRLSFTYNVTPSAYYTYAPAYRRHGSGIKLVHFIGSHKPWHQSGANRSHIASSEHPGSHDYASLVNRWFAVYHRYFNQGPSGAQASFSFPKLQATWDSPAGKVIPYTPPSLEDLKKTFQGVFGPKGNTQLAQQSRLGIASNHVAGNAIEGHYVSMPLRPGRPDLTGAVVFLPPKRTKRPSPVQPSSPARVPSPSLPTPHSTAQAQPAPVQEQQQQEQRRSPSPPQEQQRAWSPEHVRWDPARSEPPKDDRPQMESGFHQQYDNLWDAPPSASSGHRQFFAAPQSYGAIPKITHQDYGAFSGQAPRQASAPAQFPWEQNKKRAPPSRVFPNEPVPRQPSPQPAPAVSAFTHHSQPTPAFNSSGLSSKYSNAWDSDPRIKQYADTLQGKKKPQIQAQQQQARGRSLSALNSTHLQHLHQPLPFQPSQGQGQNQQSQGHSRSGPSSSSLHQGSRHRGSEITAPRSAQNGNNVNSSPRKDSSGQGYETGSEASSRDGDDEDEDDEVDEGRRLAAQRRTAFASSSKAAPPTQPHFGRPSNHLQRNSSFQNMANLTASIAAAGSPGSAPLSPQVTPTGLTTTSGRPGVNRYASQRTSSSETVTAAPSGAGYTGGLPDPSSGTYQPHRASRVFDPATATDVIRKEGLEALHRFVKNMETKGAQVRQDQAHAQAQATRQNGHGNGAAPRTR